MSDIQTLMEVTGLDRAAAQRVLTVSNNDVERAINFHLEGNTIDEPPPNAVDDDAINGANDAAGAPSMPPLDGGASNDGFDEDGVRAPIPARREQMLQPEEDNFRMRVRRPFATPFGAHNVCPLRNFQLEGELQEAQLSEAYEAVAGPAAGASGALRSGVSLPPGAAAAAGSRIPLSRSAAMLVAARSLDTAGGGGGSGALRRPKRSRLGDLFRPPVDLSVVGSLQTVKDGAKAQNRWIIVNLQDNAEFASQMMNRDIWSDGRLRELIAKYFVLWQIAIDTSEGARFQVSGVNRDRSLWIWWCM